MTRRGYLRRGSGCLLVGSLAACNAIFGFADLTAGPDADASADAAGESDPPESRDAAMFDASIDGGIPDARTDGDVPPVHAPLSIRFTDENPAMGAVRGTVVLGAAADESDVTSYDLYWGSSATTKLSALTTLAKAGGTLEYKLSAVPPKGTTHLLAFSANRAGEMLAGVEFAPVDTAFVDISTLPNSGLEPSAVIDVEHRRLLVVTRYDRLGDQFGGRPALFRCELPTPDGGTSCTYSDIDVGKGDGSGLAPAAVLDGENHRLLVVTNDYSPLSGPNQIPGLFRCELGDGGAPFCQFLDISVGQTTYSGYNPSVVVDPANRKLLAVTDYLGYRPGLFRCELDGTSCGFVDISAGQADRCGHFPSSAIDAKHGRLLVATQNGANEEKAGLFRCDLEKLDGGASCRYSDISAKQGPYSGLTPSAVVDVMGNKLLVVTDNRANSDKLGLFRCDLDDLDGRNCTYADISAGQGATSGVAPSAVIDKAHGKLLVVTENVDSNLGLFRCDLDGANCTYADLSAGHPQNSGYAPSAVIDELNHRLFVATTNNAGGLSSAGLFSVDLW